ncbi:hypothetical protein HaLaN_15623 [Haematococcus lacustris]|uniref:Uncharacterized protein n=1 Tax=Haematococcus lacustris TaxID=44745 RepID=A0A699Z7Y5_HAELA|nr:hypothetical protein HaLaN_15623 [Haematococcus lacustris]
MELPLVDDPQAFLDFQSSLEHQTCVCQALLFTVSELASRGPRGLLMLQQADCMPLVLQLFSHAWRGCQAVRRLHLMQIGRHCWIWVWAIGCWCRCSLPGASSWSAAAPPS